MACLCLMRTFALSRVRHKSTILVGNGNPSSRQYVAVIFKFSSFLPFPRSPVGFYVGLYNKPVFLILYMAGDGPLLQERKILNYPEKGRTRNVWMRYGRLQEMIRSATELCTSTSSLYPHQYSLTFSVSRYTGAGCLFNFFG